MKYSALFSFLMLAFLQCTAQDTTSQNTFSIQLTTETCDRQPDYTPLYKEEVDTVREVRLITANGIPNHQTGAFPNSGNPNAITPQSMNYEIPLHPVYSTQKTTAQGKRMGVLFSGVEVDPFTDEFFEGIKGRNREWNITTLTSTVDLGLDCNNAHVQPNGKYHYHGTPNAFLEAIGFNGTNMLKIGYAADGFPIYYKYGYDDAGILTAYESSYVLKMGHRPGDGKTAPDGLYDGTYFQDYEYVAAASELDECNGKWGRTPESEYEYYYLITDNFPSSPICFSGTPSEDFVNHFGSERSQGRKPQDTAQPGKPPSPEETMKKMDKNKDNKLSKGEVKGPLADRFKEIDTNRDGFITLKELKDHKPQGPPPGRRKP